MVKKMKVIWNPHAYPDHHQKLITRRELPLAHACRVWLTTVQAFISYAVYITTERSHNLRRLVGGGNDTMYVPAVFLDLEY